MKTNKMAKIIQEFSMLLFNVYCFNENYSSDLNKFLNYFFEDKVTVSKLTLSDKDNRLSKLNIDNSLFEYNLVYLSFKDLINNYYVLNNEYLTKYYLNLDSKLFLKVTRLQDNTFYTFYTTNKKDRIALDKVLSFTNFKYKFNFNKKERKLVFKLKNGYLKGYKYSYNLSYFEELQDNIENLKLEEFFMLQHKKQINQEFKEYKQELKDINKIALNSKFEDKLKLIKSYKQVLSDIENLKLEYQELIKELDLIQNKLSSLYSYEDSLLYSNKEHITTLEDYKLENSYFE